MTTNPRAQQDYGHASSTLQHGATSPLDNAISPTTTDNSSHSLSPTTSQDNSSSDAFNQYRMRLPHSLANGLSPTSSFQPAGFGRPTVRTASGNHISSSRDETISSNAKAQKAQVRDLVARFDQPSDGDTYAPRKYSRTASGNSTVTGYRPSASSSRAPSETRSVHRQDSNFPRPQDSQSQSSARSPIDPTYKPYRSGETAHENRDAGEVQYSTEGLARTVSGEGGAPGIRSRRPSDSLLSVPGNLASRHRAAPGQARSARSATRKYSSERAFSGSSDHSPVYERHTNPFEGHSNGAAPSLDALNTPVAIAQTSSSATTPSSFSARSRLPVRTPHSGSTSGGELFTRDQKRPLTPPEQTLSGTIEASRLARQREQVQVVATPPKILTPSRTGRSAGHAAAAQSGSPYRNVSASGSAMTLSAKVSRPGLNSRTPSENLLTQLSNAVSPPRLRLDLQDVHDVDLSEQTEFEDHDQYSMSQSRTLPARSTAVPDPANKTHGQERETARGQRAPEYASRDVQGQSGQRSSTSQDPAANASMALDKLMDMNQKSSQLVSDVFRSTDVAAGPPAHMRHSDQYGAPSPGFAHAGVMTPPPRTLSPSIRSMQTGRMTLDSDSYSVINRVLDQYHETGVVSPQMVYTFQQHILETDPELSARNDIDSLSIAKAALEDLVKDHSQSSLFQIHSRSSFLSTSPIQSSPQRFKRSRHESDQSSAADPLGIHAIRYPDYNNADLGMDSPTLPGSELANSLRFRHYSNANQLVNPTEEPNIRLNTSDRDSQDIGPTPPPKDSRYAKSNRFEKQIDNTSARPASSQTSSFRGMLPEIQSTGGGLGFNLPTQDSTPPRVNDVGQTTGQPSSYAEPIRRARIPPASPSVRQQSMAITLASTPPSDGLGQFSSKPSLELTAPDKSTPASSFDHGASTVIQDSTSGDTDRDLRATTSTATSSGPEDARLIKRRHIIKELVDTEFSFNQDMKVIEDIYKGTASAVEALTTDDRRILFGNSAQIVEFSEAFLDTLKQAAASVYVMPRTNKWRIKRGSITIEPTEKAESATSVMAPDATDEERDRKTFIGEVFGQYLSRMEKVYGDYLRNHDLANQRLARLQDVPQVALWLNECHTYASDITSAWDLDSLLVKPVQRILKYPLLLKTLLEATSPEHPDYSALEVAMKQMMDVSFRINESKKRAELLDQAVNRPNKKKDFDVSSGFSRAFGRRSDKLRQQVGMADAVEDFEYKAIAEKFGGQLFQLQVVMRDLDMYKKSVEEFIRQYSRITEVIETMIELGPSTAPKTESKWRKFTMTIREMTAIIYVDHDNAIKKHCIEPILALVKLHEKPASLMAQRKKRLPEYAKFVLIKNRGEKADKKTQQQGEQFIALSDTLKDELPKLFALNAKLVETCLRNYVDIQAQWQLNWQRKIGNVLKDQQIPTDFDAIIEAFQNDFAYTESQVLALSCCNGLLLADAAAQKSPTASTLIGTDDASSIKRPSLLASQRSTSITGNSSPIIPEPDFLKHRSQGSFQMSINSNRASMEPSIPSPSRNSSQTHLPTASVFKSFPPSATANNNRRHRSGSTSSSLRSPLTPTLPILARGSSASGQETIGFGPYQHNDRGNNRPSHPPPRSPSQTRSPILSRFSQNSARSTHGSPTMSRTNTSSFFSTNSPSVASQPPSSRSSAVFADRTPTAMSPTHHQAQQQPQQQRPDPVTRPSRPLLSSRPTQPSTTTVSTPTGPQTYPILFLAASLFEFNIDRSRKESGYPYLTYVPGEIFDVIGEKGELWLAKNQDDAEGMMGWIWEKHFAKLVKEDVNGGGQSAAGAAQ